MPLETYKNKRDFSKTPEPEGAGTPRSGEQPGRRFVVHEHHATRLHFDLRIEMDGVLKSWAVPKGPSLDPADKRLAVMTEDHPLEYLTFHGSIPEGNYGAGDMVIWDSGTYQVTEGAVEDGKLVIILDGEKLNGDFHFIRTKRADNEWLLIKGKDEHAEPGWKLEQQLAGGSRTDRQRVKRRRASERLGEKDKPDPMPDEVSPMLATLVDRPFSDPGWLFELKWDGYRAVAFFKNGQIRFASRNNIDLGEKYPPVLSVASQIDAETAVLDGELVAVDEEGRPSFQLLQNSSLTTRWNKKKIAPPPQDQGHLVYYVFDLLYLDGHDLRSRPLRERKELLSLVVRWNNLIKYSDHVEEAGAQLFEQSEEMGLEGIVAKKAGSPYRSSRSAEWLKIKTVRRQEVVIGGYTRPRGSRKHFGALVVGVYKDGKLHCAGHAGGGFSERTLKQVMDVLKPLETDECPFIEEPKTNEPAQWVRPEVVCEVKFAEWTSEGIMRHPVFQALREDKDPREVVAETPVTQEKAVESAEKKQDAPAPRQPARAAKSGSKQSSKTPDRIPAEEAFDSSKLEGDLCIEVDGVLVPVTNLNKVYWPADGYTKADLLRFYWIIRDTILPHLADRPLILKRYPNGIDQEAFFQHNLEDAPDFVERYVMDDDDGKKVNYALANDIASLLYVANLGTIAQNPFSSRTSHLEKPDWCVLDLDPNEASFETVCEVAMEVKAVLDEIALEAAVKTSGSRGMHVYVPLKALYTHDQTYGFGEIIAGIVSARRPDIATRERMIKKRGKGKVYVDYMQNSPGKSVCSVYSVRACQGATVSTPLSWEEVAAKPNMDDFTFHTVPERIKKKGDIFEPALTNKQALGSAMKALERLLRKAG